MNHNDKLEFIKNLYKDMSDAEFKARLEKAEFEIVEGISGKIIVDDDEKN